MFQLRFASLTPLRNAQRNALQSGAGCWRVLRVLRCLLKMHSCRCLCELHAINFIIQLWFRTTQVYVVGHVKANARTHNVLEACYSKTKLKYL